MKNEAAFTISFNTKGVSREISDSVQSIVARCISDIEGKLTPVVDSLNQLSANGLISHVNVDELLIECLLNKADVGASKSAEQKSAKKANPKETKKATSIKTEPKPAAAKKKSKAKKSVKKGLTSPDGEKYVYFRGSGRMSNALIESVSLSIKEGINDDGILRRHNLTPQLLSNLRDKIASAPANSGNIKKGSQGGLFIPIGLDEAQVRQVHSLLQEGIPDYNISERLSLPLPAITEIAKRVG